MGSPVKCHPCRADELGRPASNGRFAITRGNPLFIVEILKLLQAEGLMEPGEGGK